MSCPQRFQRRQTAGFRDRGTESSSHRCGLGGGCPSCPLWGPRHPSVSRAGLGCGCRALAPWPCTVQLAWAAWRAAASYVRAHVCRVRAGCRLQHWRLFPLMAAPRQGQGRGLERPPWVPALPNPPGGRSGSRVPGTMRQPQGSLAPPARSPAQPSESLRPPARPPTPGARGSLTGRAVFSLPALHPAAARVPACADCGPPCPLQGPAFPEGQGVEGLSHGGS